MLHLGVFALYPLLLRGGSEGRRLPQVLPIALYTVGDPALEPAATAVAGLRALSAAPRTLGAPAGAPAVGGPGDPGDPGGPGGTAESGSGVAGVDSGDIFPAATDSAARGFPGPGHGPGVGGARRPYR